MSWIRILIEAVVAFIAIWVLQMVWSYFPKFGLSTVALVAIAVGLVAYAVTEMTGGYASAYGRALLAAIGAAGVLSVYCTTLPRTTGHPFSYLESSLVLGVIIGLTELVVAPKNAREAHGSR